MLFIKNSYPESATADSGYCSEKNLLFLKENSITSYIKLQDHEQRKPRAYAEDIGKYYNMKRETFEDEVYYVCHDGRELRHIRTETKKQDGYEQTFKVYGCADCSECPHKAKCLYKYNEETDADKNKVMKINERWEDLKEETHANILSEKGILNRQIRSIQTEGHFGDIKENEDFRRFNYRSSEKVYKKLELPIEYKPFSRFNSTCGETIGNCLYAIYHSESFEDAIIRVLSMGGDTDTNSCIVGAVAEAMYGMSFEQKELAKNGLPPEFISIIENVY